MMLTCKMTFVIIFFVNLNNVNELLQSPYEEYEEIYWLEVLKKEKSSELDKLKTENKLILKKMLNGRSLK